MPKKKKAISSLAQQSVGIRLSSHEKLCAERMKNLIDSIQRLEKKVDSLSDSVSKGCLLYTSPSPRDRTRSRMPSSA